MSSSYSNTNQNINPKPCVYNCGVQIFWNTRTNEYCEVFTKKKHICPNSARNGKSVTQSTTTNNIATTATNKLHIIKNHTMQHNNSNLNQRCLIHLNC